MTLGDYLPRGIILVLFPGGFFVFVILVFLGGNPLLYFFLLVLCLVALAIVFRTVLGTPEDPSELALEIAGSDPWYDRELSAQDLLEDPDGLEDPP